MSDYKMISVTPETHKRFRLLTVHEGKSNDETLNLLLDEYERSQAQAPGRPPWSITEKELRSADEYHGEGIA